MAQLAIRGLVYLVFLSAGIVSPVMAQPQEEGTYTVRKKPKPEPQEPQQQQQQQTQPQQQQTLPQRPQQQQTQQPQQQRPQQQGAQQPQQQQTQRPQPPADVAERVLTRRLGSDGLQQALRQMEIMSVEAATGRGAPMADRWFDGARTRTGNDDAVRPGGTPFFRGGTPQPQSSAQPPSAGARPQSNTQQQSSTSDAIERVREEQRRINRANDERYADVREQQRRINEGNDRQQSSAPAPVTSGGYRRATVQDAQGTTGRYGGIPGGVVLEGTATGFGNFRNVRYDRRFNAFILDERAVYFMTIPPKTVAVLCRAIAQDERVGLSLGAVHIVYGAVPPDSDLAMDLKAADRFLGDIVFAGNEWTAGYRFANGYQPQRNQGERFPVAVFFNLNTFHFQVQQEEVRLTRAGFDVRLLPLSDSVSAQGGHLPDLDAISRGRVSAQYEANAQHVAEQISYYRRERIVDRAFAYGEVAAFIRALKQAGVDLQALARSIPTGGAS